MSVRERMSQRSTALLLICGRAWKIQYNANENYENDKVDKNMKSVLGSTAQHGPAAGAQQV
eukprot:1160578-Pelagomonas_calceolata.AAC.7